MWSSGSEGGGGEKDQVCRISLGLAPLQFSLLTLQPLNQKTEPFFFWGGGWLGPLWQADEACGYLCRIMIFKKIHKMHCLCKQIVIKILNETNV